MVLFDRLDGETQKEKRERVKLVKEGWTHDQIDDLFRRRREQVEVKAIEESEQQQKVEETLAELQGLLFTQKQLSQFKDTFNEFMAKGKPFVVFFKPEGDSWTVKVVELPEGNYQITKVVQPD